MDPGPKLKGLLFPQLQYGKHNNFWPIPIWFGRETTQARETTSFFKKTDLNSFHSSWGPQMIAKLLKRTIPDRGLLLGDVYEMIPTGWCCWVLSERSMPVYHMSKG